MNRYFVNLCVSGVVLLIVSIVLQTVFSFISEKKLTEMMILRPDSDILKNFKETPIPVYLQFYMFNVTNEKDVLQGAKPNLTQLGPYTYRMQMKRTGVKFNHTEGTISSELRKYYYFEPSLTVGKESDIIVTLNLVFIILADKVNADDSYLSSFAKKTAAHVLFLRFSLKPFMTRTVGEMLFHGFDEPVLKLFYPITKREDHKIGRTGFYYLQNGTVESVTDLISGEHGMENYQKIVKLNGQKKLNYWKTDSCNVLNGTEGSQFARPISLTKPLYLFSPSLCRSVYFSYEKDTSLGPLTLRRFILPPEVLHQSKENKCYCPIEFTCRSSIIDISTCTGVPMIISTPHFLDGDSRDINAVVGLNPQREEHQTFIDIEPNTGITMRGAKRVQLNMPLRKYANLPSLINVSEIIFPIFWLNETALVPSSVATDLYLKLIIPTIIVKYISWCLLFIALLLVSFAFIVRSSKFKQKITSQSKRRQQLADRIFEVKLNDSYLLKKEPFYTFK